MTGTDSILDHPEGRWGREGGWMIRWEEGWDEEGRGGGKRRRVKKRDGNDDETVAVG